MTANELIKKINKLNCGGRGRIKIFVKGNYGQFPIDISKVKLETFPNFDEKGEQQFDSQGKPKFIHAIVLEG